jgi:hypothetical protein
VHLAYSSAEDGIECLHALLGAERHYAHLLAGFEAIDRGRRIIESGTASALERRAADDLIWAGNVQLLEHEQRAVVQPNFDHLTCAFARLFSMGSTLNFEVRGLRRELSYFTSFYLYSVTRGIPQAVRAQRVAEDHALRRPLALDLDEHRSPLPEVRCRHALGRDEPASHLRRGAQLRVDALCPTAFTAYGGVSGHKQRTRRRQ